MSESGALKRDQACSGAEFGLVGRGGQDHRTLAYACACWPDGDEPEQHLLALHLAAILALDDTLESGKPLPSAAEEQRTLLPWCGSPSSCAGAEAYVSRAPIRAALARVETALASRAGMQSVIQWWRKQGELMVAACWEESRWRESSTLPDEDTYLAIAEVSIGVRWIVASLLLLDGASMPPLADGLVLTATAAVSAAVRLANDLHDTRRERREAKIQLLFLRTRALQALGYRRRPAQRRARQDVHALLSQRVARAKVLLDDRQWSGAPRLRSGLSGMLGAALGLIHAREPAVGDTGLAVGQLRE